MKERVKIKKKNQHRPNCGPKPLCGQNIKQYLGQDQFPDLGWPQAEDGVRSAALCCPSPAGAGIGRAALKLQPAQGLHSLLNMDPLAPSQFPLPRPRPALSQYR